MSGDNDDLFDIRRYYGAKIKTSKTFYLGTQAYTSDKYEDVLLFNWLEKLDLEQTVYENADDNDDLSLTEQIINSKFRSLSIKCHPPFHPK